MADSDKSGQTPSGKKPAESGGAPEQRQGSNLADSIEAIMRIATEDDEIVATGGVSKSAPDWDSPSQADTAAKPAATASASAAPPVAASAAAMPAAVSEGGSEVAALFAMLRADIDSLRRENENFKAQLMTHKADEPAAEDSDDVRALFEMLKDDIEKLRSENDRIRSQAYSLKTGAATVQGSEHELYNMLAQLRSDIVTLRVENDALRHEHAIGTAAPDDVSRLLAELKSDIGTLKHENESLRLENLSVQDGGRLGLEESAYRGEKGRRSSVWPKAGAMALVLMAAGGGYYFAKNESVLMRGLAGVEATKPAAAPEDLVVAAPKPKAMPATSPAQRPKEASAEAPAKPATSSPSAGTPGFVRPADSERAQPGETDATLAPEVEQAMLQRAADLVRSRDLGAARMVFVYLARHGSAVATRELAQTYDLQYLEKQGLSGLDTGDAARAKRLYAAAARMGDATATARLDELE